MEPRTLSPDSLAFAKERMVELLDACLNFKLRSPFEVPPTKIDEQALLRAAEISEDGEALQQIVAEFKQSVLPSSLNFGADTFLAHPDCGNSIAAMMGDFARGVLQQNLSSFDYSPAASVLELQLLRSIRKLVGFPLDHRDRGTLGAGGAFLFGGAGANFSCLLAARERLRHRLKEAGKVFDPRRTRVLTNRPFTHFSLRRSLYMLGLGNQDLDAEQRHALGVDLECLQDVETAHFRMDYDDLKRKIDETLARGEEIMCIFCTAGDSRMMAFDELHAVISIARGYGLWVHVDACEGGQVIFSPRRRHLMDGVEAADSISMDPHKVLMIPYNLSLFLLREAENLPYVTGGAATVINQDDRTLGTYTPVINSKSFISLKLWFMLKHWGWNNLAREIDRRYELALRTAEYVRRNPNLLLVNPHVQHNAVALLFCPQTLRSSSLDRINALNRQIHQRLNMETQWFVHSFPAQDDERVLSEREMIHPLRLMFGNPLTTWPVVEQCLEKIVALGHDLLAGTVPTNPA